MIHASPRRTVSQCVKRQITMTALCGRSRPLHQVVNTAAADRVTCPTCLLRLQRYYSFLLIHAEAQKTAWAAEVYAARLTRIRQRLLALDAREVSHDR